LQGKGFRQILSEFKTRNQLPVISTASRKYLKSLVDEFIDLAPSGSIDDRRQSSEEMTHVREVQVDQRPPQAAMPGQLRAHSPQLVEV
jgi:hypothetical protein